MVVARGRARDRVRGGEDARVEENDEYSAAVGICRGGARRGRVVGAEVAPTRAREIMRLWQRP